MNQRIKSIHFPFSIDQGLGVLREENDFEQHVKQLIIQVLLTSPGERINRPEFGCGLKEMIFEPNSEITSSMLQIIINQALDQWLSSVIVVEQVTTEANEEKLIVKIEYQLIATQKRQFLNIDIGL